MKRYSLIASVFMSILFFGGCKSKQPVTSTALEQNPLYQTMRSLRVMLPNQWSITPAGKHIPLGDFPMNMVVSPDKKWAVITHNGVGEHTLQLYSISDQKITDTLAMDKAWLGLVFSPDSKTVYAAGGDNNQLVVASIEGDKLQRNGVILLDTVAKKIAPTGLALAGNMLYVGTREDHSIYRINTQTKKVEQKLFIGTEVYSLVYAPGRKTLYASLWDKKAVAVIDATTFQETGRIAVGDHPNAMVMPSDESILYVANSLDNSVSIVDLNTKKELEVLNAALYPDAPNGSTTNALALSEDERTLYVANADNNCLVVYDVEEKGESVSKGFIPTGWYPTAVSVVHNKLLICSGKGLSSKANPKGPNPLAIRKSGEREDEYIGSLFPGSLTVLPLPTEQELAVFSRLVYENSPYSKEKELNPEGELGNPIPNKVGAVSPIKYVFYIIKENRTYDQVLGDIPEGNGDKSLCLFPERVTPNQHAIAKEFVLFDNFYVDAEVSADGHNWSTAAYASDYVEKTWPTMYGGHGGSYDYEGTREIAFPKGGFIWDACKRAGISYRTYGEFADDFKANYATLEGHICPNYSSWDMDYLDIDRQKDWQHDFDSLLAINQVPRFSSIRFGNDHTSGMQAGAYSPEASVADNDLAVGRLVHHISHSPIWKESAIFILEDDAQNGADHVDAHRSTAYVISPYTRRKFVDHTMYSTSSMLRTMELILGLPPMSQYDAGATPMWRAFTTKADFTPFDVKKNQVPLDTRNVYLEPLSRISETFNLAKLDAVPDRLFNEVLWKGIKGLDSEMPAPRRAAFLRVQDHDDE